MSIYRVYFSKNNTILRNSRVNTAKSPTTEIKYGNIFSKFLLQLDLDTLKAKVQSGDVIINSSTRHYLHLTNCIFGDEDVLGEIAETQRTSSFDLIVFRVNQSFDEGVGYVYDENYVSSTKQKLFAEVASNWYNATTVSGWTETGVYTTNLSGATTATVLGTQHFDNGNEDLHIDLTNYINSILTGSTTHYGLGVAFAPAYEIIAGAEFDQTVSFFTKYTQTFFEPYLETVYDDLIQDDRNTFTLGKSQNLYLYVSNSGQPIDLDATPSVDLLDEDKIPMSGWTGLTASKVTKGVYKLTVNLTGVTVCENKLFLYDKWKGLAKDGVAIDPVVQKFVPTTMKDQVIFSQTPAAKYVPFLYGIQKGEKIVRGDKRKVLIEVKEFLTNKVKILSDVYYRIYVKEGRTQVEVMAWTKANRTNKENNFYLDTSFMIPKEYFIDIKVEHNNEVATMRTAVDFQIVSER
jgi:hypothetical protein